LTFASLSSSPLSATPFPLCTMPYALCALNFTIQPLNYLTNQQSQVLLEGKVLRLPPFPPKQFLHQRPLPSPAPFISLTSSPICVNLN
jgi:hypothetical protein